MGRGPRRVPFRCAIEDMPLPDGRAESQLPARPLPCLDASLDGEPALERSKMSNEPLDITFVLNNIGGSSTTRRSATGEPLHPLDAATDPVGGRYALPDRFRRATSRSATRSRSTWTISSRPGSDAPAGADGRTLCREMGVPTAAWTTSALDERKRPRIYAHVPGRQQRLREIHWPDEPTATSTRPILLRVQRQLRLLERDARC